ncbi:hypothetical protein FQN49_008079 [Arthroderma sp. PD_2]|nr:hypothetical protein FQN49_008079 [Arthroderma sp. PD_2]
MVSRRVKICHTKQSSNSSDNAAQEAVNANLEGNGEPQNPETGPGDLAAETESAPEGAGMASLHDQDEPMHSEPDAELDDTTADSAAPASERPAPTAATNFALAHTSLAYFFSPTPHSPPTRPFSPPSRLLSPISLSAGSPPVAPPPSPASAPYHSPYSAATEPFFHQLSSLPNTQPRLPQMYPGNHNQGQFPYNNNASRWMPPMMAPGNAQHPQQGNIQISIIPVLPSGFNSVPLSAPESVNSPASSGPTPVSHPVAVAPIPEASVPPPSSPSIRVSTPVSSSPSAVSSTAAIELKKNEYKGPLIVSSYPVRPPSQPAQQPAQQQMPFAPRPLAGPIAASPQYFTNHNTGHGFNGNNNNVVGNGHRMNNNVAFAPQHYTPYPHMPMPGQPAITYPRNGPSNFNGHRCLNNNTPTASTNLVRSFPIEDPFQNGPGTRPAPAGAVLKITNIPYNLLTREVMHFLGRRAKLLPENRGSSIHVIMERSTAKTMDCYVELLTQGDAQEALAWVNRNLPAHSPRLGDRHVNVELSSQDELLREMFPRAKCVIWRNGRPEIQPNVDSYSTGFQGFLTNEEMFCMVHHAEAPKRVSS